MKARLWSMDFYFLFTESIAHHVCCSIKIPLSGDKSCVENRLLSKEFAMETIASGDDLQSDFSDILVTLKGDWRPLAKATKGDFS